MIGFPHKKSNFGINLDLHSGLFVTPVGIPLPIKLGLHVGAATLSAPFSGLGSNKGNGCNILADGQPVVSRGHEVKYSIVPHLNVLPPPPILNVLIPLLILGSSSKTQCAASKVQCTDGPLAISMMRYVGINSACADPCTMPTSMIFNWGTVNVGFTLGDIVAAIVLFVLEAITSYICDKLAGKFSRWAGRTLTNKLAGALLTPLLTYFRKHLAGKLANKIAEETTKAVAKFIWGEGLGGTAGNHAADWATKHGTNKDATAWATDPVGTGSEKFANWGQQYVDNHAEPVPAGAGT